jgi:PRC-barrel domain
MEHARYLPAGRVKAGGLRLGRLSVRTRTGQEIGKLLGFVVEMGAHQIWGLVVQSGESQLAIPMGPMQLDPLSRSLRLVQTDVPVARFVPDSVPTVADEDLWVPLFDSAA